MYNRNHVIQAIEKFFPGRSKDEILDLLDFYGRENSEYEKQRVHLAVIKLSNGDMIRLRDYVNLAKIDYRDILMSAEYNKDGVEIENPYSIFGISG